METHTAFATLLAEVEAAFKASAARRDAAEQNDDDAAAEDEAGQQKNLADVRSQLEILQELWPELVGDGLAAAGKAMVRLAPTVEIVKQHLPQPDKLPDGYRTPEEAYYIPILTALEALGGSGKVAEVLDRVYALMAGSLKEVDREILKDGTARWRNSAHWARYYLKVQGLIVDNSRRGYWEISDEGRAHLQDAHSQAKKDRPVQLGFGLNEN